MARLGEDDDRCAMAEAANVGETMDIGGGPRALVAVLLRGRDIAKERRLLAHWHRRRSPGSRACVARDPSMRCLHHFESR